MSDQGPYPLATGPLIRRLATDIIAHRTQSKRFTVRRGYASLHRVNDRTWVATGTKGRNLQIRERGDAKWSHYFSALGRKRG